MLFVLFTLYTYYIIYIGQSQVFLCIFFIFIFFISDTSFRHLYCWLSKRLWKNHKVTQKYKNFLYFFGTFFKIIWPHKPRGCHNIYINKYNYIYIYVLAIFGKFLRGRGLDTWNFYFLYILPFFDTLNHNETTNTIRSFCLG